MPQSGVGGPPARRFRRRAVTNSCCKCAPEMTTSAPSLRSNSFHMLGVGCASVRATRKSSQVWGAGIAPREYRGVAR
jgi:hypothetical protein